MKKLKIILSLFFMLGLSANTFCQAKIIFDTDLGGDADDLGALAMLNHFVERDECDLLAVMCWSTEINIVPAVDAVNTFYGHQDIPIGVRKADTYYDSLSYSEVIAENFKHKRNFDNVPDATILYRKILSSNADSSVTIVVVGPLKNIENLITSQADTLSKLDGKSLINRKVKEFVIMGGHFPEGKNEWNFNGGMPGVTKFVIQNIDVPIIFSGYEIGVNIKTGEILNSIEKNTPLYKGFMSFSQNASWVKMKFKGQILNASSFDETAVLYAVRKGIGLYWDIVTGGKCMPDDNGGNKWIEDKNSNQSYLVLKMDKEEIEKQIEQFMLGEF